MTTFKEEKVLNEQELLDEEALYKPRQRAASERLETAGISAQESVTTAQDNAADPAHIAEISHDTAICLSGGGMRSASFSLGVLQALAKAKVLEKSMYLSAVSGGNYTASWLTRWRSEVGEGKPWSQDLLEEKPENFSSRQNDLDPIRRLRSYSNYLAPRTGVSKDSFTFGFSALRKFSYNLISWLLIFLTAAAFVRAMIATVAGVQANLPASIFFDSEAGGLVASGKMFEASPIPLFVTPAQWTGASIKQLLADPIFFAALVPPIAVLALILTGWLITLVYYRSKPFEQEKVSRISARLWLAACAWVLTFVFFGGIPEYLWDVVTIQEGGGNFGFLSFALAVSVSLTAIGGLWKSMPKGVAEKAMGFYEKLKAYSLELISLVMLAALAVTSGYVVRWIAQGWWFSPKSIPQDSMELGQAAWSQLGEYNNQLATAKNLFEQEVAQSGIDKSRESLSYVLTQMTQQETIAYAASWWWLWVLFAVLAIVMFFFSEMAGANRSSLHSVYSTRLTRAFLGTTRNDRSSAKPNDPDFDPDDDILLEDIRFDKHTAPGSSDQVLSAQERQLFPLFPVINMTLNISGSRGNRQDWQERKAAPFIATPLRVGSELLREDLDQKAGKTPSTGYVRAEELGRNLTHRKRRKHRRHAQMSLGRAMAISGAAASPNMGSYTRPIVSIAMAILNIRLGWWLRNPVQEQPDETPDWWPFAPSLREPFSGFLYIFREAFGLVRDKDRWLYLSDGGHFDNVALYEMIRRECREILVVDATFDPDFEYSDLLSTLRKIRVDFGVNIKLPPSLPGQEGEGKDKRFVIGDIQYGDADDPEAKNGRLIVLKPRLTASDPPELAQYREESRKADSVFPQQSSLDQFYDETQFESYRMLGAVSAAKMLSELTPELYSDQGATFTGHYPSAAPPDQGSETSAPMAAEAWSCEASADDAGPPPASPPAPPMASGESAPLVTTLASVVQNIPTGELLLKAVGAVAATTLTVSVALDGKGVITDALETAAIITPQVTPSEPGNRDARPPGGPGVDPAVLAEMQRLRADLESIDKSLDKLAKQETLSKIAEDAEQINSKLPTARATPARPIIGPDYSDKLDGISRELKTINQTMLRLNLITPEEFEAALARVQELENGRGQSNADVNALQRQIDFLRRRLGELTTPGQ